VKGFFKIGYANYLPGLALNRDPPNLCLLKEDHEFKVRLGCIVRPCLQKPSKHLLLNSTSLDIREVQMKATMKYNSIFLGWAKPYKCYDIKYDGQETVSLIALCQVIWHYLEEVKMHSYLT
jgi:hypothetical protein